MVDKVGRQAPQKKDAVLSGLELEGQIASPVCHLHTAHLGQPNLGGGRMLEGGHIPDKVASVEGKYI